MTGRRGWAALGVATFARFAGAILVGTAPAVVVEARASAFAVGLVGTAYYAGLMLFSPSWGALADITGRRRLVLVVTGVGGVPAVLPLVVADAVPVAVASRGVYAGFLAGFAPVALAIDSHHGGRTGRGRSIGLFNSTRSGGFTLGYVAGGGLPEYVTPVDIHWAIAAVTFVSTVTLAFVADPTPNPRRRPDRPGGTLRDAPAPPPGTGRPRPPEHQRARVALRGRRAPQRRRPRRRVHRGAGPRRRSRCPAGSHGRPAGVRPRLEGANHVPVGVFADRAGRKPLVVAGMAGSAVFAVMAATMTAAPAGPLRVGSGVATFVVLGGSFSAMTIGGLAFIDDVAPVDRESELMGFRETAKKLGVVVGPARRGGAVTLYSYELAFAGASVGGFAAAGLVAWGLVETYDAETRSVVLD